MFQMFCDQLGQTFFSKFQIFRIFSNFSKISKKFGVETFKIPKFQSTEIVSKRVQIEHDQSLVRSLVHTEFDLILKDKMKLKRLFHLYVFGK